MGKQIILYNVIANKEIGCQQEKVFTPQNFILTGFETNLTTNFMRDAVLTQTHFYWFYSLQDLKLMRDVMADSDVERIKLPKLSTSTLRATYSRGHNIFHYFGSF